MDTPTVNRRPQPNGANSNSTSRTIAQSTGLAAYHQVGSVASNLQPNRNTWSSSASVDRNSDASVKGVANSKGCSYSSDVNKLSDLEILAKQEMIYCMSQSRSGLPTPISTTTNTMSLTRTNMMRHNDSYKNATAEPICMPPPTTTTAAPLHMLRTTSITSMGVETLESGSISGSSMRMRKIGRDETALMEAGKANRL